MSLGRQVAAWRVRGRVPLGVDSTAALVEAAARDHALASAGAGAAAAAGSEHELRLQYSMALVRMVNGIADSAQRGRLAASVASLAGAAGLPRLLVDLRHEATHNELPSLAALRLASQHGLAWLQANYWQRQSDHVHAAADKLRGLVQEYLLLHKAAAAKVAASAAADSEDSDEEEEEGRQSAAAAAAAAAASVSAGRKAAVRGPGAGAAQAAAAGSATDGAAVVAGGYQAADAKKRRKLLLAEIRAAVPRSAAALLSEALLAAAEPVAAAEAGEAGAGSGGGSAAAAERGLAAALGHLASLFPQLPPLLLLGAVRQLAGLAAGSEGSAGGASAEAAAAATHLAWLRRLLPSGQPQAGGGTLPAALGRWAPPAELVQQLLAVAVPAAAGVAQRAALDALQPGSSNGTGSGSSQQQRGNRSGSATVAEALRQAVTLLTAAAKSSPAVSIATALSAAPAASAAAEAGLGAVQTRRGTALPAASVPVSRRSTRCSKVHRTQAAAAVDQAQKITVSTNGAAEFGTNDMARTVLGIILGGGAGSRLYPLTKKRAKPAVPLGANYRLIDIPVSNCINSGVNKIYCLTQFNSASLNRHLSSAYNSNVGGYNSRGFVEVLAASQTTTTKEWFQGTADAVRQYMWLFDEACRDGVEDFLILSGDHLYRMDYREFVAAHRAAGADITVAALPCAEEQAQAFGLMKIDDSGRIVEFAEKPKGDALKAMQVDTTILGLDAAAAKEQPYIASMGIYVCKASALQDLLESKFSKQHDFGSDIIPGAKDLGYKVQAHLFKGYWEDIGTVRAFYESNLALTDSPNPQFSFYDKDAPIYTMSRFLPPSKVMGADVERSILGDGCIVEPDAKIHHSVVGLRSIIREGCVIEDSLLMGADFYEQYDECEAFADCLPLGVGKGTHIRGAIVDKNARIGRFCKIINAEGIQESFKTEDDGWVIRDGVVVVIKDSSIPDGTDGGAMGRTKKRQRPHQQHGSHPSLPPLRGGVKKPAVHEHQHQLRQQQQQKRPRELWEGVTAELRQALEAGHQEGALLDSPLLAAGAGAGGSSYTLPGGRRVLVVSITAGVPGALQELRQSMTDRYIGQRSPVALIQLASRSVCLLLQMRSVQFSPALQQFFSDPGVTLVGFAWRHGDEGKMQETFGLGCAEFGSFSDLQELAHDAGLGRGRGVAALAEMVLGVALSKSKKASRSNWSFWGGHPFLQGSAPAQRPADQIRRHGRAGLVGGQKLTASIAASAEP
ncbi:ADP-glucose pyrophosphorylase small subunit isoform A [Micractinium conductrix]|uniref:Glucose-1-phosphate adenylyltransferase n=1 Tax=Micractinium conductrix TaxID=554055 RepID=A0A2P6VM98_9CHLO|nr:ADP-glucose pyrophosphorylase small subunit isoform A [Micractinium conductrix]|eukprot:PSC75177.1 ADP-glucose pyrophosphorylase small subunit isoform A [Micractinium conductrix]